MRKNVLKISFLLKIICISGFDVKAILNLQNDLGIVPPLSTLSNYLRRVGINSSLQSLECLDWGSCFMGAVLCTVGYCPMFLLFSYYAVLRTEVIPPLKQ